LYCKRLQYGLQADLLMCPRARDSTYEVEFDTRERTMKDSGKAFAVLNAAKAGLNTSRREKRIDVAP
jgi:hypothetical protein